MSDYGPKRSKRSIDQFESWLKERCRNGPVKVEVIECEYQYKTGHEPRKIREYLRAIESSGKISLLFNGGVHYCEWISEEMQNESATEYMRRRNKEKESNFIVSKHAISGAEVTSGTYVDIAELRKKLKEKLSTRLMANE